MEEVSGYGRSRAPVDAVCSSRSGPLPIDSTDEISRSSLRRFDDTELVTILFCGACSSPMFYEDWPPLDQLPRDAAARPSHLDAVPIRCRCGDVDLLLHRPDPEPKADPAAERPWYIDPRTLKRAGSFDTCDSCRLWSGVDVFHWTFALLRYISFAPSATAASLPSPDVQRYFCRRCSASVFYAVDDRPDIVDLAVGLLWSPNGAHAENLLAWSSAALPAPGMISSAAGGSTSSSRPRRPLRSEGSGGATPGPGAG
ncbi:hypothetical protein Micbo1qcDRAFT_180688 [Microdochium bolleyi]|uniref:Uncharacterized protein n=1 Tax=Microdochium bolleyi TaxID=196109 RepID=A0A136IKN3_9PEZI|nr:hypothetical protein Micbo1qcDRAFT_180688 [Microdochium bolleyi]